MISKPTPRLLSLADELLLAVIEQIDSQKALCALSRTCSKLQAMTEPFIYKDVFIRTGEDARTLVHAGRARPERLELIHSLTVRYIYSGEDGIEELNHAIDHMRSLKDLMIESPCPNNSPWRDAEEVEWLSWCRVDYPSLIARSIQPGPSGEPLSFPMLQSLTLHAHGPNGEDKFGLGKNALIFRHPTVKQLSISCSDITDDIGNYLADDDEPSHKSTPLTSLTFIECNISSVALLAIMRMPKALREISIGERLYSWHNAPTEPLRAFHETFMMALGKQQDSLEFIRHVDGGYSIGSLVVDPRKFPSFSQLRSLHLGSNSVIRNYLHVRGAPPSLELLRLHSIYSLLMPMTGLEDALTREWKDNKALALNKIPQHCQVEVLFIHTSSSLYRREIPTIFLRRERREHVYEIAKPLKQRGSKLQVFAEYFPNDGTCIPPYLYGEETPQELPVYDSDRMYRFCGMDYQRLDDENEAQDSGGITMGTSTGGEFGYIVGTDQQSEP